MNNIQQQEDEELVADLRLGKIEAFELIVTKYQTSIRAFCAKLLSDDALGEEAAQDAFVKAYQSIRRYHLGTNFKAWLFRIARNHSIDILRKNKPKTISYSEVVEAKAANSSYLSGPFVNQASLVEGLDFVDKMLAMLSCDNREIFLLREVYGMSYKEIAAVLECSVDVVKGRLKRMRAEVLPVLRHKLETNYVSNDEDKND